MPFSRGAFIFGPPLRVPRHLSPEEMDAFRERLERLLSETTSKADDLMRKE
ncbi:MAG: hypothetical protein ACMUIM_04485 [bacterium]|jgi:hypothetical protein